MIAKRKECLPPPLRAKSAPNVKFDNEVLQQLLAFRRKVALCSVTRAALQHIVAA